MKKLICILIMVCAASFCLQAQWYLFPGKNKPEEPRQPQTGTETVKPVEPAEEADTIRVSPSTAEDTLEDLFEDLFVLDRPEEISVAVVLPLQADSDKPSVNFLDMYSGALLAVRDLSSGGMKVRVKVIDSKSPEFQSMDSVIDDSDLIIGPVTYDEISTTLPQVTRSKRLVSPLEPKAATLVDSSRLVQAPAPWYAQEDALVDWVKRDSGSMDEVIVIRDPEAGGIGEQAEYIISSLDNSGIKYRTVNSLSGISFEKTRGYRFIIASDRDAFIKSMARAVGYAGAQRDNVFLYATSKVRSLLDADAQDLYHANTRLTAGYYIDYNSEDVKDFVLAYRALFKKDPGQFAFQGYDTMHYFLNICNLYGRKWYKKLPEYSERGLQSDFKFLMRDGEGQINTAVKRVIYSHDLSASVQ